MRKDRGVPGSLARREKVSLEECQLASWHHIWTNLNVLIAALTIHP